MIDPRRRDAIGGHRHLANRGIHFLVGLGIDAHAAAVAHDRPLGQVITQLFYRWEYAAFFQDGAQGAINVAEYRHQHVFEKLVYVLLDVAPQL